jgi:hypothetical protein
VSIAGDDVSSITSGIELNPSSELTDEEKSQITQAFMDHRFVKFIEAYESELVNEIDSHHYEVQIDTAELTNWANKVREIAGEKLGINDQVIEAVQELAQIIDSANYDLEMWIAKDTKTITRMKGEFSENNMTFDVDIYMTDYNQVEALVQPSDAIPVQDLILNLAPLLQSDSGAGIEGLFPTAPNLQTTDGSELNDFDAALGLPPISNDEFPSFTLGDTDSRL